MSCRRIAYRNQDYEIKQKCTNLQSGNMFFFVFMNLGKTVTTAPLIILTPIYKNIK